MNQEKQTAVNAVEEKKEVICRAADQIWEYAELSLQEEKSAAYYCRVLREEGFLVEEGICNIPTAFAASFGTGSPRIGILAEYDALSGLSQEAGCTEPREHIPGGCGHGCGHQLLGAGAMAAARGSIHPGLQYSVQFLVTNLFRLILADAPPLDQIPDCFIHHNHPSCKM